MTACVDDFRPDFGEMDGSIRDLHIEVCFEPNSETKISSRSNNGDAIQDIHSLRMLVYDKSGENLLRNYLIWNNDSKADTSGDISNESYDGKADNRLENEKKGNDSLHDTESGKLSYDMKLPTGEYYIYAVANAESELAANDYSTRDKLKAIRCNWQTDRDEDGILNLDKNSQMFGIYDLKENRSAYKEDKPIKVTNASTTLHCWLRRLASKVTVAFDGTGLYDNVQVYIETITLRDIPKSCTLGNPNRAGQSDMSDPDSRYDRKDMYNTTLPNVLIETGEQEIVQEIDHNNTKIIIPDNFIHVCNTAHPYLGKGADGNDPEIIDRTHSHTAKSLFFYENIQGEGKDKRQDYTGPDGTPDGELDHPGLSEDDEKYIWKDNKPYGTYIEVKGWYRCVAADGHVGDGPITYRFMLGKDELKDYNAERNTHYKLTLCLKGYGNDADWHIEYEHKRGLHVASPQFISYLYNKKMVTTLKIKGKIPDGAYLWAHIEDETSWKPWGDDSDAFPIPPKSFYAQTAITNDGPWHTFLSLRQTKVVKIEREEYIGAPSNQYPMNDNLSKWNKEYYTKNRIGDRWYKTTPSENGYESNETGQDGMYFVKSLEGEGTNSTERVFTIPLYTRAKELITRTGFTGNNPYTAYPRKGRIKFTLVTGDGTETAVPGFEPVYLDIIQVRRIINPKGVWRKSGSKEGFHVTLLRLPEDDAPEFVPFKSEGKWSAEVISNGASPITLSSTREGSGDDNKPQYNVNRIVGEAEHNVDFMINFTGISGCAIVKVRYHNFTCEHDIFCREGFEEPIDITDEGKITWPSYNISHFEGNTAVYTKSPLEEGGLFRRGNTTAILAENNNTYGLNADVTGKLSVIKDDNIESTTMSWSEIKPNVTFKTGTLYTANDIKYHDWLIDNENERIARSEDYYTLIAANANDINFPISKAYGILYGDGAKETLTKRTEAYGYDYTDGTESPKGMRGVFVYNTNTTKQLFFPIGFSGYGHRQEGSKGTDPGILRYAGRKAVMKDANGAPDYLNYRPLFIDLWKRPGAIYWIERYYERIPNIPSKGYIDSKNSSAFDINFYTMGFEGYGGNDAFPYDDTAKDKDPNSDGAKGLPRYEHSHACFIRTVIPISESK